MNLKITHHPAPEVEGVPASKAPENWPLRVVWQNNAYNDLQIGEWALRYHDLLIGLGSRRRCGAADNYRVEPLPVGERLVIEAEGSE